MRDFFHLLKAKILKQPDRNFDQRFWAKFESEFSAAQARKSFWSLPARWVYAPVASAAAVILVVMYMKVGEQQATHLAETQLAGEILAYEPIVENLDLLDEFEELPDSEEDWETLLGGTHAS